MRAVHVGSLFISLTLVREGIESECAATLCNGRFRIGCFLIGSSVPRLRCGGITKLWFEVSLVGSVLCTPVHLLIFHHGSPGGYVPSFLCWLFTTSHRGSPGGYVPLFIC